jgi:hypothetical protein
MNDSIPSRRKPTPIIDMLVTDNKEPFNLIDMRTLIFKGPISQFTVTFDSKDFENLSVAKVEELAEVLSKSTAFQDNGFRVIEIDNKLGLSTTNFSEDPADVHELIGGTACEALGLIAPMVITGHATQREEDDDVGSVENEDDNDDDNDNGDDNGDE